MDVSACLYLNIPEEVSLSEMLNLFRRCNLATTARFILTIGYYTHWVHRSPHRSCSPSRSVWTEWPSHRFGCLTETVRNEGENKSTGTNYFSGE